MAAQGALLYSWQHVDERRTQAELPVHVERREEPAHDLFIEHANGTRTRVPARSGGFQLVHFWASWCPPCRTELPALLAMAQRSNSRLRVWGVSTDRDWKAVRAFVRDPLPPLIVRDAGGLTAAAYGVTSLPDTYLIDPQGRVLARFAGAQQWNGNAMKKTLKTLMRSPAL